MDAPRDMAANAELKVNEGDTAPDFTAPTNGAAGVIPATLRYFIAHVPPASRADIPTFLLIGDTPALTGCVAAASYP